MSAPLTRRVKEFGAVTVEAADILTDGKLDFTPEVRRKGYFAVRVGAHGLILQAQGFVGVIPVNDRLTLEVEPRAPLSNLSRILELSGAAPVALAHALRLYEAEGRMYPSLAAVYARGLRDAVEAIVDNGLLKEYVRVEEVTSVPRGRIDVTATMQRLVPRGMAHRVAVSRWQRTADRPVNQCLLYAAWRLSRYATVLGAALPQRERRRIHVDLNYVANQFASIHLDPGEHFLTDDLVTGRRPLPQVRSYYRPALELALAVIGRRAPTLERPGGEVRLPSLVADVSAAFEAYIRRVVVLAATDAGAGIDVLDGNIDPPAGGRRRLFHSGADVTAMPAVVYRDRRTQRFPLLLEIKYKPAAKVPDRDDLNQAISYAFAYRSPHVVLVQPRDDATMIPTGLHPFGRVGTVTVWRYVIDLSGDLLVAEAAMARRLGALAQGTAPATTTGVQAT